MSPPGHPYRDHFLPRVGGAGWAVSPGVVVRDPAVCGVPGVEETPSSRDEAARA